MGFRQDLWEKICFLTRISLNIYKLWNFLQLLKILIAYLFTTILRSNFYLLFPWKQNSTTADTSFLWSRILFFPLKKYSVNKYKYLQQRSIKFVYVTNEIITLFVKRILISLHVYNKAEGWICLVRICEICLFSLVDFKILLVSGIPTIWNFLSLHQFNLFS